MKKETETNEGPLDPVRGNTLRYARELLDENQRLLRLAATLASERAQREEQLATVRELEQVNVQLRETVNLVVAEKAQLQRQLDAQREEFEAIRRERDAMTQSLLRAQKEIRRFAEECAQAEMENSNLATLYTASYRLHGTLDPSEVLASIQEIIINLVGSEEVAIYDCLADGALSLVASFGLDSERCREVPADSVLRRVQQEGTAYLAPHPRPRPQDDSHPTDEDITACIPLQLDGRTAGLIVIYRLLEHKTAFEFVDKELFELLTTHAATSLYYTRLHAQLSARGAS